MSERIPVETLEELDALDDAEMVEGYWDGRDGEPEPGSNRSKAHWHGWRCGAMDVGRLEIDPVHRRLVRAWLARERAKHAPR